MKNDPTSTIAVMTVLFGARLCSKALISQISNNGGSDSKESTCDSGDPGLIVGSGRSPGEGNGYPLQYSCLENAIDRGAWWATVHGVAKSWT